MQDINVNKVVLIGRIEEEPVFRHTQNNTSICSFRVGVSETYMNRDGNRKESKSTHTVVVWGQKADALRDQAHANSRIFVEGSIRNRSYDDREGNKKWVTEINAQTAVILDLDSGGGYQTDSETQSEHAQPPQNQPDNSQGPAQQPTPALQQTPPTVQESDSSHTPEDDLPF